LAGEEPTPNIRLTFWLKSASFFLCFSFKSKDPALREADDSFRVNKSRKPKPKPKISSPTNMSHEPGEKGVIKAIKPKIIRITPRTFRKTIFT
jgi:hypothetical protein